MTTPIRKKTRPITPGAILEAQFLRPLGLTQKQLADHIGVDIKTINRMVNGRCAVTPELAVLLGRTFNTQPMFWLALQNAVDVYDVSQGMRKKPKSLIE